MSNLHGLTTEEVNRETRNIDEMEPYDILRVINQEDQKVALAVEQELPQIAKAVDLMVAALKRGGRVVYLGAGTSGRLGVLDAAECPPTFGTPKGQFLGLIAGGEAAILEAVEGAEDSPEAGVEDLRQIHLSEKDVLVGIAASGRTPYVIGGLTYGKSVGTPVISLCCNQGAAISALADVAIVPVVGPEVVAGSTRMKAGTAQKMVLNMMSTATMIAMGKVYHNLMVDLQATNQKLMERSKRIIMLATGIEEGAALEALKNAGDQPKVAIVMVKGGYTYQEAVEQLEKANGFIKKALE